MRTPNHLSEVKSLVRFVNPMIIYTPQTFYISYKFVAGIEPSRSQSVAIQF